MSRFLHAEASAAALCLPRRDISVDRRKRTLQATSSMSLSSLSWGLCYRRCRIECLNPAVRELPRCLWGTIRSTPLLHPCRERGMLLSCGGRRTCFICADDLGRKMRQGKLNLPVADVCPAVLMRQRRRCRVLTRREQSSSGLNVQ